MWTCGEMKKEGWSKLGKTLWAAVLVTLIFVLISGVFSGSQYAINLINIKIQYPGDLRSFLSSSNSSTIVSSSKLILINMIQSLVGLLALVAAFFLINPLGVGYARWFLTNRKLEGSAGINLLFSSFRQGSYMGIVAGTAWVTLWTFLWGMVAGLCFLPLFGVLIAAVFSVIFSAGTYAGSSVSLNQNELLNIRQNIAPAFIITFVILLLLGLAGYLAIMLNRKYAYFFTSFILAENPTIGAKNALDFSKRMTHGMKGKLFLLDLSFIGWWLLSSMTCGILALGIMPYTYATYTEVYISRKVELHI